MAVITDRRNTSPGPARDPGNDRARMTDPALFFAGLVALAALLVFGTLAVLAALPIVVPGYTSASITSGSMSPTLNIGDVVIAVDHGDTAIEPETIVVYEDPRKHDLVTHRVVGANPDGTYTTKGDGNGTVDPLPIPEANIKGTARWIVPFVGYPRVWLAQGEWLWMALFVGGAAFTLWLSRFAVDSRHDPWSSVGATVSEEPPVEVAA